MDADDTIRPSRSRVTEGRMAEMLAALRAMLEKSRKVCA